MDNRIALIDIGSNSVRMVIFREVLGCWIPFYNEKALCALGRDLATTGVLSREGRTMARNILKRFAALAEAQGVTRLHGIATEAIRSAKDGPTFANEIQQDIGIPVTVITGEQEGWYSAHGVLACRPQAHGLCGDMGGSSLELVALDHGQTGRSVTLPTGALRLAEFAHPDEAARFVAAMLDTLPDTLPANVDSFYAVGGSWRSLARHHQQRVGYPLDEPHLYRVATGELLETLRGLSHGERLAGGKKLPGVSRGRAAMMPGAALLLEQLVHRFHLQEVVFCSTGLREGYLLYELTGPGPCDRTQEAAAYARMQAAEAANPQALQDWLAPVLGNWTPARLALLPAFCQLADIVRYEERERRAFLAYHKALFLPLNSLDHFERAFLALSLFARYDSNIQSDTTRIARALLPPDDIAAACVLGAATRLAKTVTGGQDGLLPQVQLVQKPTGWELKFKDLSPELAEGDHVTRRLKTLNKLLIVNC